MSSFNIKVNHIPKINEFNISGTELALQYENLDILISFPRSDHWYYYTDIEGLVEMLRYLVFSNTLYKADKFDCEDYAMKAQTKAGEVFGKNALRYTYGNTPRGPHGFLSIWTGNGFMLFEPNSGFQEEIGSPYFAWGENGYEPSHVLL